MPARDRRILAPDWHILGDLASILGTTPHTKKGVALPQNDNARLPRTVTDPEYLQPDTSYTLALVITFIMFLRPSHVMVWLPMQVMKTGFVVAVCAYREARRIGFACSEKTNNRDSERCWSEAKV